MMIKTLMHLCQHMEMGILLFTIIWYQLLCFPTQIHFKLCWWIIQLQRLVAFMIIWMMHHVPKQWGGMVLIPFFCTFTNVSLSIKQKKFNGWSHYIKGQVSRLLKTLRHILTLKRLASNFIMSQGNPNHYRNKPLAYNII